MTLFDNPPTNVGPGCADRMETMTTHRTRPDTTPLDRSFAEGWYAGWIDAWNSHRPERVSELLTEDFVLDSPTTRHTGWWCRASRPPTTTSATS
jgi:hypothetical protein